MVVACELGKRFYSPERGEFPAVSGVSFAVEAGRIFGLLGPNGAGKTTTLRMLATLLQPTEGTATISGWDVVGQGAEARRHIGYMSGGTGLYGRLTPRELVRYFGRLYGLTPARVEARIDTLFTLFGIHPFADVLVQNLSTGMKQKVSLARTLVHDPPVLILDEPTTGLDVLAARGVRRFIREAAAAGKSVLLSTHVMQEAEALCDTAGVISGGRLLAVGPVPALKERTEQANLEDAFLALIDAADGEGGHSSEDEWQAERAGSEAR
jgi:sodium transport system ATP-binding protein